VRFDHVVIAVTDLESASSIFRDTLGFSLKPGRVHDSGLRNVHIRFANGSALELMATGPGEPDELSEWYRRFLERGAGGAFVALSAGPPDTVLGRLGALAAQAVVFEGRAFDWVSFPEGHPLHAFFFVNVRARSPDEPGQLRHRNGALGLAEVWIETPAWKELSAMLARFDSPSCGRVEGSAGLTGWGHGLSDGMLVASQPDRSPGSNRVHAVVLDADRSRRPARAAGVRLLWRGGAP
jgi:catechol 2,3-dioxygenase-like lactoylglutathione lyase family enzyme